MGVAITPGTRWKHRNGIIYEVVAIANEPPQAGYPITVVYRGVANGKWWTRPVSDWARSFTPEVP